MSDKSITTIVDIKDLILDYEDIKRISEIKWYYNTKRTGISRRIWVHLPYKIKGKTVCVSLSNEIMHTRGILYDHRNRNNLDYRKENLRIGTQQQNTMNRTKIKNGTSKHKGVTWSKSSNKWKCSIVLNGENIHLGYFENEIIAARTYNNKAVELFKEFANLNRNETGGIL